MHHHEVVNLSDEEDDLPAPGGCAVIGSTKPLDLKMLLGPSPFITPQNGNGIVTSGRPLNFGSSNTIGGRYVPFANPSAGIRVAPAPTPSARYAVSRPPIPLGGGAQVYRRNQTVTSSPQMLRQVRLLNNVGVAANMRHVTPATSSLPGRHDPRRTLADLPSLTDQRQLAARPAGNGQPRQSAANALNGNGHMRQIAERRGDPQAPPLQRAPVNIFAFEALDEEDDQDLLSNTSCDVAHQPFRCSFMSCRRVLHGNYSMMCHLWAHLAVPKTTDDKYFPIRKGVGVSDVDALAVCPQCLARFATPYAMQVHYTRCHSRVPQAVSDNVCIICEREESDLHQHCAALHPDPLDAPYNCPVCSYRTNVRRCFLDHFARKHSNSSMLQCPFCPFSVQVPRPTIAGLRRRRDTRVVKIYLNHIERHEIFEDRTVVKGKSQRANLQMKHMDLVEGREYRRISCNKCAMSFNSKPERSKHLATDHAGLSDNYRNIKKTTSKLRRKSRIVTPTKLSITCDQCSSLDLDKRPLSCVWCLFAAARPRTAVHANIVFLDDVDKKVKLQDLYLSANRLIQCECGWESRCGREAAAHFHAAHWNGLRHQYRKMTVNPREDEKTIKVQESMEEEEEEDLEQEYVLFGLTKLMPVSTVVKKEKSTSPENASSEDETKSASVVSESAKVKEEGSLEAKEEEKDAPKRRGRKRKSVNDKTNVTGKTPAEVYQFVMKMMSSTDEWSRKARKAYKSSLYQSFDDAIKSYKKNKRKLVIAQ